ncbi:GNAT family N-acetyltransferase [Candidatus Methylomirabilis sp.]|uniref:GNAT family N-acetyltransferase n=1 Tax=Candidatus Methylomirabilis tolerans TaxID=3123416 RepID=A0AAJ1AJL8_9BACT|nr:GNAT family N-acetyltransferase [Candidatus Methylomirabilis sp.]
MLAGFPKQVTLRTGTSVTIRPIVKEDAERLHAFFCKIPREDRLFLRDDVSLREVIDSWMDDLDYGKVLPLVAEVDDAIVADATLHRRRFGWTSHVGKVRLVVDRDYRGKGLGTLMIEELINIAKRAGLEILVAEIMGGQTVALSILKRLGFEREAVFYNYVKDQTGEEHDLVVMMKNLQIEPAMVPF